jgi:hypothetical protein
MRIYPPTLLLTLSLFLASLTGMTSPTLAADWQWSVPMTHGRAWLWIPPDCKQVRAVIVGQHNMIEQGIFEDAGMRKNLADLGIAEVWIAPPMDRVFRFDQGAGDTFNAMMQSLADASGYAELEYAPVIPMGHSACASYPWNFAAWNPGRTLAVLSVKGDAPLTNRTGSGKPNPDWGDRSINGIPGLMVMDEYEWFEDRILPLIDFQAKHPGVPLAMLAEPGSGHFNYNKKLIDFLGMFIRKAVALRLPADTPAGRPPVLKPVDPRKGWLVERWHLRRGRTVAPAPYAQYSGDRAQAFWCFDEEMARAIQDFSAEQVDRQPQLLSLTDGHVPVEKGCGRPVDLNFYPDPDGVTFHVKTAFLDAVPAGEMNYPGLWAGLPVGSPLGHATGGGPIVVDKIVGPVKKISGDTFALRLDHNAGTDDNRLLDIWLWASQPGDDKYKSIVQQATVHVQPNTIGTDQHITFPPIPDQKIGEMGKPGQGIVLGATSDSGMKVYYYVREGPAEISEGKTTTLLFQPIPPRSKFPVEVTVVAWQWGRTGDAPVKTATPVERTFFIVK